MATDHNFRIKNGLTVGAVEVIDSSGKLTANAFGTNSNEKIEDVVADMITGSTHSNITVTYNDTNGTLAFSAAAQYGDSDVESYLDSGVSTPSFASISSGAISLSGGIQFNGYNANGVNQINGTSSTGWLDFNMDTASVYPQSTVNQTVLGSSTDMNFVGDSNGNGTGGRFYWGYGTDGSDTGTFTTTMDLDRSGNLTTIGAVTVGGDIYAADSNSSTNPSITFTGHTNTGLSVYQVSNTDRLSIITGGAQRVNFGTHGVESFANVYTGNTSSFRNYGGTWSATTGVTGNGFSFINSVDGTAATISSTGDLSTTGSITTTDGAGSFGISGDASSNTYLIATGEIRVRPSGTSVNKLVIGSNGNITTAGTISSGAITSTGNIVAEDSEVHVGDTSGDNWTRIKHAQADGYGFDWQHDNASVIVNEQGSTNQVMVLGDVDAGNNSGLFGVAHSTNSGTAWTKKLDLRGNGELYIGASGTNQVYHEGHKPTYAELGTMAYSNLTGTPSLSGYATETYVNTAVSNLVDSAPGSLDTLNELAAALGDDASFSTTVTNSIASKVSKSGDTITSGTNVGLTINHDTFGAGLRVHRNHASNAASIQFLNNGGRQGTLLGIASDNGLYWQIGTSTTNNKIFHDTYHPNADKWTTARSHTVTLTGDVTGTATQSVDGTGNNTWSITTAVGNDSHTHDTRYFTETETSGFLHNTGLSNLWSASNSKIVTFDYNSPTNGPGGWVNGFKTTHSNYLHSYLTNKHRTHEWHFGWRDTNSGSGTWVKAFHDDYHPNADKWTSSRTLTLGGDLSGSVSFDGSANFTLTAAVADDSHNHIISNVDGLQSALDGKTSIDHFRHTGHGNYTSTTTSALLTEALGDDAFDSKLTAHKTGWSYAGNGDLTDAGRLTELAGTSWLWWTDNSADNVQGNITGLVIAPNTGGSFGKMFVYNNQGASYNPGWREVWTSLSDGAGSGLDADLLDGQEGSYYLNYNNFTNTPSASANYYLDGISKSGNTLTFSVNGATNQSYAFGSNAFNSTTIPTNNNQLTNGAGYTTYTANQAVNTSSTPTFSGLTTNDDITFNNSGTTKRGIRGTMGDNDMWFVGGGATASNAGYMEIAIGDDGQTSGSAEQMYFSQYGPGSPWSGTLYRRHAMFDANGQTIWNAQRTPTSVTSILSDASIVINTRSGSHNYIQLRNDSDDGTHAGLVFTDNNHGGSVLFTNHSTTENTANRADTLHLSGYQGVDIRSGTGDASVPSNKTRVARFATAAITLDKPTSVSGNLGITGSFTCSTANTTGGGIILADDGDIVDLNDAYCSMRFSYGVRIYSGNKTGTAQIALKNNGEIIANSNITAYGSASDERLKENIETIKDPIKKVQQLRGVTFDYKKDGSKSTGLIAQELEKVLPEVVYETVDVDNDNNKYKAVRYGNTVGLLVEAIKEQQEQIEELKQIINTLVESK